MPRIPNQAFYVRKRKPERGSIVAGMHADARKPAQLFVKHHFNGVIFVVKHGKGTYGALRCVQKALQPF